MICQALFVTNMKKLPKKLLPSSVVVRGASMTKVFDILKSLVISRAMR